MGHQAPFEQLALQLYPFEETLAGILDQRGITYAPVLLSGDVNNPGFYNLPDLTPVATQTATYLAAGTPVSDSYTGIKLWDLVNDAGGATVTSAKNDILSKFVVAVGADGYEAVFSMGEINPSFGNQPVMVAYSDAAGQLGAKGSDGLARVVVPGDHAGGRYVSELVNLQVGSLKEPATTGPGGVSDHLSLTGQVADPTIVTPATLQALNQSVTETATYTSGSGPTTDTYTGVSLWDVIQDAGLLTDPSIKNDLLRYVVVATGSDGYRVAVSLGEISPNFGNQQDLVAYADTGKQLGVGGADGAMRLIVPGDHAGGRYVSNLVSLQVIDATSMAHTS
jgi:hypothetical protein